jgi:outer membrane protein
VAKEEGYTYIFNTSAGGTTIMLFGPAEDDVTDKVLKKMGITRPAPTPAPSTPAAPAGTTPAPKPATPGAPTAPGNTPR